MKRLTVVLLSTVVLTAAFLVAQGAGTAKPLQIYVVDAEGGKAVLYVSPTGQTALIDSGNAGGRDTDRIMEAIADAGVKQIDYMISTHYHSDHVGGFDALSKRIPMLHFVDHGPTVEGPVNPAYREQVPGFQAMYAEVSKDKRITVKPGDRLPITGLDWRIVTSAGHVLKTPLPGAGKPNPECAKNTRTNDDALKWTTPDDDQSVGSVITFGQFRAIDLGDLLYDHAVELACPNNMVGTIDVYFASGHGTDITNAPPLINNIHPLAAVVQNGTRKGGQAQAMQSIHDVPGLADMWQLHWSYNGLVEQNSAGVFIANIDDAPTVAGVLTAPARGAGARAAAPAPVAAPSAATAPGTAPATAPAAAPRAGGGGRGAGGGGAAAHTPAYWIKVTAQSNGTFTISNSRNGYSRTYSRKPAAR